MRNQLQFTLSLTSSFATGTALSLWLAPVVSLCAAYLGGSLLHNDLVLAATISGISIGLEVRRRLGVPRLGSFLPLIVATLCVPALTHALGLTVRITPLLGLLVPALAAVPAAVALGRPFIGSQKTVAPALFGAAAGFALAAHFLSAVGYARIAGSGLALGALAIALELRFGTGSPKSPGGTPQPACSSPSATPLDVLDSATAWPSRPSPAVTYTTRQVDTGLSAEPASDNHSGSRSRGGVVVAAGLSVALGALWTVTLRPLTLGWHLPPHASWAALSVAAAALGLASVVQQLPWLRKRSRPAPRLPLLLALPPLGLAAFLWLLPIALRKLSSPFADAADAWISAALLAELELLVISPLGIAILTAASARHRTALLLLTSISMAFASLFAVPALSGFGLLRILAAALILLITLSLLLEFFRPENRTFTRLAVTGFTGVATAIPWLAPHWNAAELLTPLTEAGRTQPAADSATPAARYTGEDGFGTVVVTGTGADQRLYIQREPVFLPDDALPESFAGHLPMLLHPMPGNALVIGAGAGLALDAMRAWTPAHLFWANPSPLQVGVIQLFGSLNHQVLIDPRLQIRLEALRPAAARNAGQFDAVTVLRVPVSSLEGRALYAEEGFTAVRNLLTPGGVAAIELDLDQGNANLPALLAAFRHVFPDGLVWLSPGAEARLLLTGSTQPLRVSYERLELAFTRHPVRDQLATFHVRSALDILGRLLLTPDGLATIGAPPTSELGPWPPDAPAGGRAPLAQLLPALRPLVAVVTDLGDATSSLALQAQLDQIVDRHKAYLSMLEQLEKGVFSDVIGEARKLLELSPRGGAELDAFTEPYLVRARRFREEGRLDKAIEQLSVVRLIQPSQPDAPFELGLTYEKKGQKAQAVTLYRDALKLRPDSIPAAVALANLYREEGRLKEAASLLEDLLTRVPGTAALYNNLGSLYLALDQWARARGLFEQSVRLDARLAEPHLGLAEVFFRQGRYDAAQEEAQIGTRLTETAYGLNLLGQIALRRGDGTTARSAFVRCLLKDPDYVEARGAMGILYAEEGAIDKARESWETVLSLAPDNRAARENLERLNREYPPLTPKKR